MAKAVQEGEIVHFHHDAIDLIFQPMALLQPLLVVRIYRLKFLVAGDVRIDTEAQFLEPMEGLPLGGGMGALRQPRA